MEIETVCGESVLYTHKWLEYFTYRLGMSWWTFLLAGVLATMIAVVIISFQAIRAAFTNPVKTLRCE
jgi:putative ABC transport system permease protein